MFREKVLKLINLFEENDLPFRMFEGFRSPQRQDYLYQQGRSRPGNIITNARPWTSFHQYGLAADFVLFINNKWSWDTSSKINRDRWTKLHE